VDLWAFRRSDPERITQPAAGELAAVFAPSRGFFRWNPMMACFSQFSSQKSRGTQPLCSFTLP
jgi:hypothetical protein